VIVVAEEGGRARAGEGEDRRFTCLSRHRQIAFGSWLDMKDRCIPVSLCHEDIKSVPHIHNRVWNTGSLMGNAIQMPQTPSMQHFCTGMYDSKPLNLNLPLPIQFPRPLHRNRLLLRIIRPLIPGTLLSQNNNLSDGNALAVLALISK
jgi:hypothetical protein